MSYTAILAYVIVIVTLLVCSTSVFILLFFFLDAKVTRPHMSCRRKLMRRTCALGYLHVDPLARRRYTFLIRRVHKTIS